MSDLCKKSVPLPEAMASLTVVDMDHMVVEDMAAACRGLGCFQVINHGISQSVMDNAVAAASGFFKLPGEAKREFASDDVRQPVRYTTSSNDGVTVSRSFLKLYAHPLSEWTHYWPTQPPVYREHMAQYASEVRRVALQLMEAILQGLGLGEGYRRTNFEHGLQLLAVNGYPEASGGDTAACIAMAPHSDYAFLTVLLTDCPGLEVLDRRSGSWRAVVQQPSSLHVHLGDHMEVLSNGRVRALVHRAALNPEQARVSIGSFHGFGMHDKVCCAQEFVDEGNPRRYRDSSFADFLDHLVASTDKEDATTTTTFLETLRM